MRLCKLTSAGNLNTVFDTCSLSIPFYIDTSPGVVPREYNFYKYNRILIGERICLIVDAAKMCNIIASAHEGPNFIPMIVLNVAL